MRFKNFHFQICRTEKTKKKKNPTKPRTKKTKKPKKKKKKNLGLSWSSSDFGLSRPTPNFFFFFFLVFWFFWFFWFSVWLGFFFFSFSRFDKNENDISPKLKIRNFTCNGSKIGNYYMSWLVFLWVSLWIIFVIDCLSRLRARRNAYYLREVRKAVRDTSPRLLHNTLKEMGSSVSSWRGMHGETLLQLALVETGMSQRKGMFWFEYFMQFHQCQMDLLLCGCLGVWPSGDVGRF